jgi:class 3 adenylate cyclase
MTEFHHLITRIVFDHRGTLGAPGIGVHYREWVLGSIGDAQQVDYVVVGDTVNVASRLERLTRELDFALVVRD